MNESRPDPRKRPPDPAGTQPKVDPESLRARSEDTDEALAASHAGVSPTSASEAESTRRLPAALPSNGAVALAGSTAVLAPGSEQSTAEGGSGPGASSPVVVRDESTTPQASRRPHANPHAPRFQFLFGALGALSVAAIALAIALLRAPAAAPERPWSAWRPVSGGVDPAQQIAEYVAPQYRLSGGKQIVQAFGGPPTLKGQPLTIGIVHSGQTPAPLEGNNVLYQLCGDGVDCSIKEGKPSNQRGLLVAREALELALYTFRYVSGVDRVLVTMPPPPPGSTAAGSGSGSAGAGSEAKGKTGRSAGQSAAKPSSGEATGSASTTGGSQTSSAVGVTTSAAARAPRHALIFSRQDLEPEIERPLSETLSAVTPGVSQMSHWPDAAAVTALTDPHIYDFTISETQQGLVMLLEPPGLGG